MSYLKKHITTVCLVLIFLVAAFLRMWRLGDMPPAVNWDEVSHGYNAYSILKTGSDEWGKSFPLANFRAYGDYPLPLNLYITIPFIYVLGLNEISIRLPHAILGVLTVMSVYFLSEGIFKRKQISLLASFLCAIEPWYFFTSRFVLQSNLSVFFLILAATFFVWRKYNKSFLILSTISFGITLFSYHSTRIFTPLLIIPMVLLYRRELVTKLNLAVFLLFFVPLPFILANPQARARSNEVFLLNPSVVYSIEVTRNSSQLPEVVQKMLYNRPTYLLTHFAQNYVEYFSPKFLFIKGGTQYQFSIPDNGLLYLIELPFFYIGLIFLTKRAISSRQKEYFFLISWLILAPIPASITTEHFAVLRASPMLPIPELLVSFGFFEATTYLRKKVSATKLISGFILLLIFSLISYLRQYDGTYRSNYSWAWQFGYKDVVTVIKENYSKYDKIIITKKYGEPHEFLLFYTSWDPKKYKEDSNLIRFNQSNWWWVDGFDKFMFVNDWEIPKEGNLFITESKHNFDCNGYSCLLITSPDNSPKKWNKIKVVNFLDNKPAFEIYEN